MVRTGSVTRTFPTFVEADCECGKSIQTQYWKLREEEVISCGCQPATSRIEAAKAIERAQKSKRMQEKQDRRLKMLADAGPEIGKQYGRLTIEGLRIGADGESRGKKKYTVVALTRCECGTRKDVVLYRVRSGEVKSCGCLMRERLAGLGERVQERFGKIEVGARYGLLTVNRSVGVINRYVHYECTCDCGNLAVVRSSRLKSGTTRSCGCLRRRFETANERNVTAEAI